jgi:RNA recognition motif-containing protein
VGKIYVGNIPFKVTEEELRQHFSTIGEVHSVKIIHDRETNLSKGFCFIEMENFEKAILELHGKNFQGRFLKVNAAVEKPRVDHNSSGYQETAPVKNREEQPRVEPRREQPIENNYREENRGNRQEQLPRFEGKSDSYRGFPKMKKGYDEQTRFKKQERFV